MKKVENELRTVYGGTTVYTCTCGYKCTKRTQCVAHVATRHPFAVGVLWYKLFWSKII